MEVPESVRIGLANIRPTLHARWNPQGKQTGGWSFDANGRAREKSFEGRWELWDVRKQRGTAYKVATLEKDGQFVPLGDWVFQLMYEINPANYEGDMNRMIDALVDKPNEDIAKLGKAQLDELFDYMADFCWSETHRDSRIVVPQLVV